MDLIRALGLAGIRAAVVTEPDSPSLRSRFVDKAVVIPNSGDVELLEALIGFAESCPSVPVLYYQQDSHLLFISRHREQLAKAFRFVIPDAELVEDLVDKARFQALAEALNLPVPKACRVRVDAGSSLDGLELRLPVVVKPVIRTKLWHQEFGSTKALAAETREELHDICTRLAGTNMELLIQEFVLGPESCIESYHTYRDAQGHTVAHFTGRKIRTWPLAFGHSTALTITRAPDVVALGQRIADRLSLRGVAKFDFKRDRSGKLHLLEVNPRFNLWHHLGAVAGVNIPASVYADLVGAPVPAPAQAREDACWCSGSKDFLAARASGVSPLVWAAWALRCEARGVLAWDDPMPFLSSKLPRVSRQLRQTFAAISAPR